jgi:hypothetical protein
LSRHRKIQLSRSKAFVVAAAGALSVATAASAAAATWTQGSAAGADGPADVSGASAQHAAGALRLTVTGRLALPQAAAAVAARQGGAIPAQPAYQVRLAEAPYAIARWKAAQRRAAELAAKKTAATAGQTTAQTPAATQPSQAASATVPAASGSPRQIAQAMLGSFGWSSSQFSCLDPLWAHESGWSVTSYNAGSGAYGIPQALPGSRMASAGPDWQTSAATQITWGLEYIRDTYGSPCGAWDHEQATGWY